MQSEGSNFNRKKMFKSLQGKLNSKQFNILKLLG